MANELNELTYNNTPITFTGKTDNIATSDETKAPLLYQDTMGTAYSKSKAVSRVFNFAGISLILTAAAIKTGSLISNVYILNPPSVGTPVYTLGGTSFSAEFTVSNSSNYKITYYLYLNENEEATLVGDCSEEKDYLISYDGLTIGDEGHFYIEFTNSVDYKKTLDSYTFKVEG